MYTETKSTNLSAIFTIDDAVVINMYASGVNVNISIQNYELYKANQQECDEAIEEFKQHVEEMTEEAN